MTKRAGEKVLRPVHPNAGIAADYRRRMDRLIAEMQRSYVYWLTARYKANEPRIAMDATPAEALARELADLGAQWQERFYSAAPKMARWFARSTERRSADSMRRILKDAGVSVKFQMTPVMRDVFEATVAENVGLIKSIPQKYHTEVEGLVMRSVTAGRDLGYLTDELQARYGITRRRAALIARDQNNKATASMTRARQQELGIEEAVWLHSHGGKEPRRTHLANSGNRYKVSEGWYDPDPKVRRHIWPGELINCFPADTKIDSALDVEVAYRHWHSGDLTEIVTDSGKTLRATVNHPILTGRGWRPIGSLDEGDHVVEVSQKVIDAVVPELDEDDRVSAIVEIFHAVQDSLGSKSKVALGADFHGDSTDRDVDVVLAARPLGFGRKVFDGQSLRQFGLAEPDNLVPELTGKRKNASTAFVQIVKATRIVEVKRCRFDGHVFNLQTSTGWYVANGIVSHNCRCVAKPVIKGFS